MPRAPRTAVLGAWWQVHRCPLAGAFPLSGRCSGLRGLAWHLQLPSRRLLLRRTRVLGERLVGCWLVSIYRRSVWPATLWSARLSFVWCIVPSQRGGRFATERPCDGQRVHNLLAPFGCCRRRKGAPSFRNHPNPAGRVDVACCAERFDHRTSAIPA